MGLRTLNEAINNAMKHPEDYKVMTELGVTGWLRDLERPLSIISLVFL